MFRSKSKEEKDTACRRYLNDGENNTIFTPYWLEVRMVKLALRYWYNRNNLPPYVIVDPCCGKGTIFEIIERFLRMLKIDAFVGGVEINEEFTNLAQLKTKYKIQKNNFLTKVYEYNVDIIIMNPPFSEKGEFTGTSKFIDKALSILSDNGVVVSVVPDYFVVNSEKRKEKYANNIKRTMWLPQFTFDTDGDGKPNKLHAALCVFVKNTNNETYIFKGW